MKITQEEEKLTTQSGVSAVSHDAPSGVPDRTRRRLVQAAGTVLAASTLPAGLARAASRSASTLRVGFISPRTGPLAGFGESDPYVLHLARKALAKGLRVDGLDVGGADLDPVLVAQQVLEQDLDGVGQSVRPEGVQGLARERVVGQGAVADAQRGACAKGVK